MLNTAQPSSRGSSGITIMGRDAGASWCLVVGLRPNGLTRPSPDVLRERTRLVIAGILTEVSLGGQRTDVRGLP